MVDGVGRHGCLQVFGTALQSAATTATVPASLVYSTRWTHVQTGRGLPLLHAERQRKRQSFEHRIVQDIPHRHCTSVPILRIFHCVLIATQYPTREAASRGLDSGGLMYSKAYDSKAMISAIRCSRQGEYLCCSSKFPVSQDSRHVGPEACRRAHGDSNG